MTALHLRVLGSAVLTDAEHALAEPLLGPGKLVALVTYLTLAPRRTASREQLVDLLWGEDDPDAARRNLRQAIYQLRRRLGPSFLGGSDDEVVLAAPITSDRDQFLAAAESGEMAAAVVLYSGPFFPAFAAPGGAAFEQWADLERRRVQAVYLHALDTLTREHLREARWREAIIHARRLRDTDPDAETGWRLLLEALISAAEWIPASLEADACEALLHAQAREPTAPLRAILRAARQAPPVADPQGSARLVAEMIGRESEFSAVLASWAEARRGRLQRLHLLGTAGIGKSRLLREVAARLTATQGRLVMVRAVQGEHDLPWAVAGDLVRALAALPGAAGISSGSAGILLGLDPSLGARFPAARATVAHGDELLRLRSLAIAELVAAVSEEAPLALLLDDLHWSDPTSRRALLGVASRATSSPVLLLTTSRSGTDGPPSERPEDSITLRTLSEEQVGLLVESIAPLPAAVRQSGLVEALHAVTLGNPLLVIEALQTGQDRGWLHLDAQGWVGTDLAAFLEELGRGSPLARRVAVAPPDERRMLLALAVYGRPLADGVVAALPDHLIPGASHALEKLEGRGLAVRGAGGRELAHDLLADSVREAASGEETRIIHEALGLALLATAAGDAGRLRAAGHHLAEGGNGQAQRAAFREFVQVRRSTGDRTGADGLAADFLGPHGTPRDRRELKASLPLALRWPRSQRLAAAGVVAGIGAIAALVWLDQPARLEVSQLPLFLVQNEESVPVIVDVLTRSGKVDADNDGVVTAALSDSSEFSLEGERAVRVRGGRAVFKGLRIVDHSPYAGGGWVRLRLSQAGLPPILSDSFVAGVRASGLWLDSGVVNDQRLAADRRVIHIGRGAALRGTVHLSYTTTPGSHTVMLAVVPTWGDRRRRVIVGGALATGRVRQPFTLPLDLSGPAEPGRYRVVLAAAMETEARFVASATGWTRGEPKWFDGNDLADITPDEAAELDTRGLAIHDWLVMDNELSEAERLARLNELAVPSGGVWVGRERTDRRPMLGTTIEVVVE